MLFSTQLLIAALRKRREFLARTTDVRNPCAEAVMLKNDIRQIGSKKQRQIVMFNFG